MNADKIGTDIGRTLPANVDLYLVQSDDSIYINRGGGEGYGLQPLELRSTENLFSGYGDPLTPLVSNSATNEHQRLLFTPLADNDLAACRRCDSDVCCPYADLRYCVFNCGTHSYEWPWRWWRHAQMASLVWFRLLGKLEMVSLRRSLHSRVPSLGMQGDISSSSLSESLMLFYICCGMYCRQVEIYCGCRTSRSNKNIHLE